MILSMTGFGKSTAHLNNKKITVEVKSLNSKQLDLSVRLPQVYREMELELRKVVSQALLRGKVEMTVVCEADGTVASSRLNVPMLLHYKQQLEQASQALGIPQPGDWFATLLRMPDVMMTTDQTSESIPADEADTLRKTLDEALFQLNNFRQQEGARLCQFFEEKINGIQQLLDQVPQYEQTRVEKIKARIVEGLAKLEGVECDNNRLEQELIYYIEKLDITEEKIRLQNHLNYFLDTLHNENGQGKKLGFITQEMGREINTMGSKANQAELQNLVVRMKDHLEQIKEQVLNVL